MKIKKNVCNLIEHISSAIENTIIPFEKRIELNNFNVTKKKFKSLLWKDECCCQFTKWFVLLVTVYKIKLRNKGTNLRIRGYSEWPYSGGYKIQ